MLFFFKNLIKFSLIRLVLSSAGEKLATCICMQLVDTAAPSQSGKKI
jgi:hypothetical protein